MTAARCAFFAALAMLLGCAHQPRIATDTLREHPERLIVVTVANPAAPIATRAGSTPRAYDAVAAYSVSGFARSTVAALAADYMLVEVAAWPIDTLRVHCVVFRIAEGSERAAVLARLSKDTRVQIAQPLQVFATSSVAYNDPYVELQSGFKALDIAAAHVWSRGDGVRIAVIDTGIDAAHPDLVGRIVRMRNFVDGDRAQFYADRHGTGVAGVIAAAGNNSQGIVGIAPGVKLIALKACWQLRADADDARCNSFTLAQALSAAFDADADIVNLSVSGPADPLLSELIAQGLRRGAVIVGAAPSVEGGFPVSTPGVIAVDAAERRSGWRDALPAPGREILTLQPSGRYDFASGSSLATAHVAGAIALLLQQNRKLSAQSVQSILQRSRGDNPDNKSATSINACAALTTLTARGSCSTAPIASAN